MLLKILFCEKQRTGDLYDYLDVLLFLRGLRFTARSASIKVYYSPNSGLVVKSYELQSPTKYKNVKARKRCSMETN